MLLAPFALKYTGEQSRHGFQVDTLYDLLAGIR
jgi:hypothetical protein